MINWKILRYLTLEKHYFTIDFSNLIGMWSTLDSYDN